MRGTTISINERLKELLSRAAALVRGVKSALIVHHDEADGICSAAIASYALQTLGVSVRRACLDKLFPELLSAIYSVPSDIVVFSDLGSAHAHRLKEACAGKPTIILDHHDPVALQYECLVNVNPELAGYSGEDEAAASTIAYLFALELTKDIKSYSHLALIGAFELGERPGQGLNLIAVRDAIAEGLLSEDCSYIKCGQERISISRASTLISVLASVGYYRRGPELAIEFCLKNFPSEHKKLAEEMEKKRRLANRRLMAKIRSGGLNRARWVDWFDAGDVFTGMSGKVLGSFCSYLRYQKLVSREKYLVGFMNIPREVPGLPMLSKDYTKLSARTGLKLEELIRKGRYPPLSLLVGSACELLGGFGDGHSVAASGIIPRGTESEFISKFENLVSEYLSREPQQT
jgi:single-stranded-DNA-specific exonuclease